MLAQEATDERARLLSEHEAALDAARAAHASDVSRLEATVPRLEPRTLSEDQFVIRVRPVGSTAEEAAWEVRRTLTQCRECDESLRHELGRSITRTAMLPRPSLLASGPKQAKSGAAIERWIEEALDALPRVTLDAQTAVCALLGVQLLA